MKLGQARDLTKIIILVPLAVAATIFAIGGAGIVSLTHTTRVGVNSLFAYWAAIPAAATILALQRDFSKSKMVFSAAFLVPVFIRINDAIGHIFTTSEPLVVITSVSLSSTLIELGIISVVLLIATLLPERTWETSRYQNWIFAVVVISLLHFLQGVFFNAVTGVLTETEIKNLGLVIGSIVIAAALIAIVFTKRLRYDDLPIDKGFFVSGLIVIAISAFLFMQALTDLSPLWIYAENLEMAALLMFGFSLGIPLLKKAKFPRKTRYMILIGLLVTTYIPLLITTIIESSGINYALEVGNILAYSIIHTGAGALSVLMAFLLYAYSRLKPSGTQYPLILIFMVWTGVAATSVVFALLPLQGEPVIPYFVGGLLTLFLLYYAVKWTNDIDIDDLPRIGNSKLVAYSILLVAAVAAGELLNQFAFTIDPSIILSPWGSRLLLMVNLINLFGFAYLVFLLSSKSEGRVSFETFVLGLLTLWIVPNTLKSYYTIYTAGWWVSELIMFLGLLIGPAILALLYIRSMQEIGKSHARAMLYADLLMHDITNYNQIAMTTFELLSQREIVDSNEKRLITDAQQAVTMAEQLIDNVRLMSEKESMGKLTEEKTNLVNLLVKALDTVTTKVRNPDLVIQLKSQISHAYVMANDLLYGALLNLLYTAIDMPLTNRRMKLDISPHSDMESDWWQVRLEFTRSADQSCFREGVNYGRSSLGFLVAKIIAEEHDGILESGDDGEISFFSLNLPMYKDT